MEQGISQQRGHFEFRLWPTILTAVMLPVLVLLGTWQLHRLHEKVKLIETIGERMHMPPVDVMAVNVNEVDYHPATVSGVFHNDLSQFVFATAVNSGLGGFHLITPLEMQNGAYLFVDRGWVPYAGKQTLESYKGADGTVQLRGILRWPVLPGWLQPENNPDKGEWYNVQPFAMAKVVHITAVMPYVFEVDGTPNAGVYPVGGQTRLDLPNNHLSYALTWYGFALILAIIYVLSCYRPPRADLSTLETEEQSHPPDAP